MEFHEKLQELRKQKGLTQEELAQALFVSRTAISKWESGRGYPNIESLKAIAKFYGITIDALLSGEEALSLAEEEKKHTASQFMDLIFGLLDLSAVLFLFLPLFGQTGANGIQAVSLTALTAVTPLLKGCYFILVTGLIVCGLLTLALQKFPVNLRKLSFLLNSLGAFLLIISTQPYAAALLFLFLLIKALILYKNR